MSRRKLEPEQRWSPDFCIDIVVPADDIDEWGHVSNLVYLRWILRVARGHTSAVGYDFEAYRAQGAAFVVRRHEIDYLRPAYQGETLRLRTWVESWRAASSIRRTVISRGSDAVEIARASTLWAFVSLASGRPQRIPAQLKERFRQQPATEWQWRADEEQTTISYDSP